MRKLTGQQARALRRQARCPDCASTVIVDRALWIVHVHHNDGCPMRRSLAHTGRLLALVRPGHDDPYTAVPTGGL